MTTPAEETAAWREWMVQQQLEARGIRDEGVLRAMREVPREAFLPDSLRGSAYEDHALPIGRGQTISQPYTVAFMCAALQLTGGEKALEIGTGSGYAAAVLSRICREVHTVERIAPLAEAAAIRLKQLGYANVFVHEGDGTLGWPTAAPYDAIVVTAGGRTLPEPYRDQLVEGGRIVAPLGPHPQSQIMYRYRKRGAQLTAEDLGLFAFVPLIGQYGWPENQ